MCGQKERNQMERWSLTSEGFSAERVGGEADLHAGEGARPAAEQTSPSVWSDSCTHWTWCLGEGENVDWSVCLSVCRCGLSVCLSVCLFSCADIHCLLYWVFSNSTYTTLFFNRLKSWIQTQKVQTNAYLFWHRHTVCKFSGKSTLSSHKTTYKQQING